jgi:hypothetical protein
MTGAMVATSIVFFPAAPLFLFMHGKDITIPKGHEVTVYTNTDYDTAKLRAPAQPSPPALPLITTRNPGPGTSTDGSPAPGGDPRPLSSGPLPLNNADILKSHEIGLSDQLIVEKIKSAPSNYRLDVNDLIELKKAGLSDAIIGAMIGVAQKN